MALVVADRVKETTTSTGTGAISLGGAVTNFRAFSSVLSNADTTYYAIIDNTNFDFEVGLGTYATSGNTITRTTVLSSSNSNSAVNFGAGTKDVILTYPADKAVVEDANGAVAIENLQIDTNAIKSTDTNGNIQLFPNGTGFTELYGNTNAGTIRFNCEANTHGVTLKGPPHSASATYTLELPNADGSAGQLLKTDGSGKLAFTSDLANATATQLDITAQGDLRLQDSSGGEYVGLQAPATVSSSFVLTMPAADGTSGQAITTNGSGTLSFSDAGISTGKSIAMAIVFG